MTPRRRWRLNRPIIRSRQWSSLRSAPIRWTLRSKTCRRATNRDKGRIRDRLLRRRDQLERRLAVPRLRAGRGRIRGPLQGRLAKLVPAMARCRRDFARRGAEHRLRVLASKRFKRFARDCDDHGAGRARKGQAKRRDRGGVGRQRRRGPRPKRAGPCSAGLANQEQAVDPSVTPNVAKLGDGPVDLPHEPPPGGGRAKEGQDRHRAAGWKPDGRRGVAAGRRRGEPACSGTGAGCCRHGSGAATATPPSQAKPTATSAANRQAETRGPAGRRARRVGGAR